MFGTVGGRRALYGTLPFVAAFGMQHRESSIRYVRTLEICQDDYTASKSHRIVRTTKFPLFVKFPFLIVITSIIKSVYIDRFDDR